MVSKKRGWGEGRRTERGPRTGPAKGRTKGMRTIFSSTAEGLDREPGKDWKRGVGGRSQKDEFTG